MHHAADANLTSLFEELTARSLADQVRTAQRYRELLQQVAAGELDATALRAEHDRLLADHQAQLARDLTTLGVRYYQSILDLNRAYADRLFDALTAAARTTRAEPADDAPPPPEPAPAEVRLRGRPGERVEAGFAVENTRDAPADVVFYASEFSDGGGASFRAALELGPPQLRLPPHTEHRVALGLELDPDLFRPGGRYHGRLLVRGAEEIELEIVVEVTDEAD